MSHKEIESPLNETGLPQYLYMYLSQSLSPYYTVLLYIDIKRTVNICAHPSITTSFKRILVYNISILKSKANLYAEPVQFYYAKGYI